jgi:hypothetical protein
MLWSNFVQNAEKTANEKRDYLQSESETSDYCVSCERPLDNDLENPSPILETNFYQGRDIERNVSSKQLIENQNNNHQTVSLS